MQTAEHLCSLRIQPGSLSLKEDIFLVQNVLIVWGKSVSHVNATANEPFLPVDYSAETGFRVDECFFPTAHSRQVPALVKLRSYCHADVAVDCHGMLLPCSNRSS